MIPAIGLIVAIYACARLIQVPLEHSGLKGRHWWLAVISIPAILVIGVVTIGLMASGVNMSSLGAGLSSDEPNLASTVTAPSDDKEWRERLQTIVTNAGHSCSGVANTYRQGTDPSTGENEWNVTCQKGEAYAIALKTGRAPRVVRQ